MPALLAEDVGASFLFVGDLNGHHQEWLGSTTTNSHGVVTVSCYDQLVVGPTHARGEHLTSFMMTDVPYPDNRSVYHIQTTDPSNTNRQPFR